MKTKDIIGQSYRVVATGLMFKVLSVEGYSAKKGYSVKKISKQYENILAIKPGYLAAVNYRGTLIPNITLEEGVVRIMSIEIDGEKISKPKAISKALGIENNVSTHLLQRLN